MALPPARLFDYWLMPLTLPDFFICSTPNDFFMQSLKEKYADFISKQIETGAPYLPTFSAWAQRKEMVQELTRPFQVRLTSEIFGTIIISSGAATYESAVEDAKLKLQHLEARHCAQNGRKTIPVPPLTERQKAMVELFGKEKVLEMIRKQVAGA